MSRRIQCHDSARLLCSVIPASAAATVATVTSAIQVSRFMFSLIQKHFASQSRLTFIFYFCKKKMWYEKSHGVFLSDQL